MLLVIALEPTTSVTDEKSPRTEDKQEKPLAVVDQPDHRLGDANGKTCFIFLFMLSALQMHSSRCLHSLPPLSPLSPPSLSRKKRSRITSAQCAEWPQFAFNYCFR